MAGARSSCAPRLAQECGLPSLGGGPDVSEVSMKMNYVPHY